jgi:hypothetical protein
MATITQVLRIQKQIDATEDKLADLRAKRCALVKACQSLNKPRSYANQPAETFMTINAVPCRLLVYSDSQVDKEELRFE